MQFTTQLTAIKKNKFYSMKKKTISSYGLSAFYYCIIYLLQGTKIATITIYFVHAHKKKDILVTG